MYDPLQTAIVVLSLVAAAATAVLVVLNRRPTSWLLVGLAALEAALLVQLVVGVVQVVGGSDVSALTFLGYLVGMLAIVPVATLWAWGEPGRGGTSVLLVGTLVIPVLVLRLEQIWSAGG